MGRPQSEVKEGAGWQERLGQKRLPDVWSLCVRDGRGLIWGSVSCDGPGQQNHQQKWEVGPEGTRSGRSRGFHSQAGTLSGVPSDVEKGIRSTPWDLKEQRGLGPQWDLGERGTCRTLCWAWVGTGEAGLPQEQGKEWVLPSAPEEPALPHLDVTWPLASAP